MLSKNNNNNNEWIKSVYRQNISTINWYNQFYNSIDQLQSKSLNSSTPPRLFIYIYTLLFNIIFHFVYKKIIFNFKFNFC